MKVQNKSQVIGKEAIQQIKDEVTIHVRDYFNISLRLISLTSSFQESLGKGTFIASFYASWQSRSKLYTVLQYVMGYGDLYLLWRDYGPFNEDVVRIYAAEIGHALGWTAFIFLFLPRAEVRADFRFYSRERRDISRLENGKHRARRAGTHPVGRFWIF